MPELSKFCINRNKIFFFSIYVAFDYKSILQGEEKKV